MALALKEAGVSGVNELLASIYPPFTVGKSVLDDMARNGTIDQLPADYISNTIAEQINRPYGQQAQPDITEEETDRPEFVDPFVPELYDEGSLQLPRVPAAAPRTRTAAVSPALLGDNPVDVARNMEIASVSGR